MGRHEPGPQIVTRARSLLSYALRAKLSGLLTFF
jgi:hypothetical protein